MLALEGEGSMDKVGGVEGIVQEDHLVHPELEGNCLESEEFLEHSVAAWVVGCDRDTGVEGREGCSCREDMVTGTR